MSKIYISPLIDHCMLLDQIEVRDTQLGTGFEILTIFRIPVPRLGHFEQKQESILALLSTTRTPAASSHEVINVHLDP